MLRSEMVGNKFQSFLTDEKKKKKEAAQLKKWGIKECAGPKFRPNY
jgi:hypothetical protein